MEGSPYIAVVQHGPLLAQTPLQPPPAAVWYSPGEQAQFVKWATATVEATLPDATLAALRAFDSGDGPPAILLRGLGVDAHLEGTDAAREPGFKKHGQRSEAWILGLASLFGDVLATDTEAQAHAVMAVARGDEPGPIEATASIGHLVAREGKSRTRVAHDGTTLQGLADLNLHRDGMFDEYGTYNYTGGEDRNTELFLPDKLFLFCNRGDPGGEAKTWLHDMKALHAMLSQEDRDILSNNRDYPLRFFDGADTAGGRDRQVAYQEAVAPHRGGAKTDNPSVISGTAEQPRVSLQESRPVIPERSHPAAVEAYQRLFTLAQQTRVGVPLEAGDLLILKNNRTLHGRSPYSPRYDDSDRWVQRFTSYQPAQVEAAVAWLAEQHQAVVQESRSASKL